MPGQAHDLRETDTLICGLSGGHLLADRAFDADWLRNALLERGITRSYRQNPTGSFLRTSIRRSTNGAT